jgi:3-mercaptopyruvate sulfurtransferase SseA
VKLLDGGRKKWELDPGPVEAPSPARPATIQAKAQDSHPPVRDDVVGDRRQNLVDVRSPDEFSGSCSPRPTAGRLGVPAHPHRLERPVEQGGQR